MSKQQKTKRILKAVRYEWAVFGDAYLGAAFYLSQRAHSGQDFFKEIEFTSYHPNDHLIWPIIFNFKHGIELYLKCLSGLTSRNFLYNHDPQDLFQKLKKNIRGTKEQKKKKIEVIKRLKNDVWSIVEKYYLGKYICNNRTFKFDIKNEAERYPQNDRAYKMPDPYKWLNKISKNTGLTALDQIQADILKIHKVFWKAKMELYKIK